MQAIVTAVWSNERTLFKEGGILSPLTRLVQLYFVLYFSFLFLLLFVQRSVTLQEKPVMGIVASNHRTRQSPTFRPLERTISISPPLQDWQFPMMNT